jgi:hypothetical protein
VSDEEDEDDNNERHNNRMENDKKKDVKDSKSSGEVGPWQAADATSASKSTPVYHMSRSEASRMNLVIESVDGQGADLSQVGAVFACLSTGPPAPGKSTSKDDLLIGRSATNHVVIKDLSISKLHAAISYFDGKGFLLRDLGSKHGTSLDDRPITVTEGKATSATDAHTTKGGESQPPYLSAGMRIRLVRYFISE